MSRDGSVSKEDARRDSLAWGERRRAGTEEVSCAGPRPVLREDLRAWDGAGPAAGAGRGQRRAAFDIETRPKVARRCRLAASASADSTQARRSRTSRSRDARLPRQRARDARRGWVRSADVRGSAAAPRAWSPRRRPPVRAARAYLRGNARCRVIVFGPAGGLSGFVAIIHDPNDFEGIAARDRRDPVMKGRSGHDGRAQTVVLCVDDHAFLVEGCRPGFRSNRT